MENSHNYIYKTRSQLNLEINNENIDRPKSHLKMTRISPSLLGHM